MRWEVAAISANNVQRLLEIGWEPFAVTSHTDVHGTHHTTYHLRRQVRR